MHKYLLVAFMGLFLTRTVVAQETAILDSIDYNRLQIPPLEVLFENARKSPAVELYQAKMEEQASLLKTEKRSWLKYFKVGGSWQYGRMGVNSAFSDQYTPLFYSYSGATQNAYYGSASIAIPLDDLFDRKNRIRRQEIATKSTQMEIEKWYDEQKIQIIEAFTEVTKQFGILKATGEARVYAGVLFETSLNDFQNGNIKISELNVAKTTQMNAIISYENCKAQLTSALLRLEILSKTKIISK